MPDTDADNAPTIPPALAAFVGAYSVKETVVTVSADKQQLVASAASRCALWFSAAALPASAFISTKSDATQGQGIYWPQSFGPIVLTSHHDPGLVWSSWYAYGLAGIRVIVFEVFYMP